MSFRSVSAYVTVAVFATACSTSDDSESASPTVTTAFEPALETIATVPPTVEAPSATAAPDSPPPTTTRPEPRLPERMARPTGEWAPVDVPSGDALRPVAVRTLVDVPATKAYDVSPDGRYLARLDAANRLCLVSTDDPGSEVCDETVEVSFATWAPDSSMVLFNFVSWTEGRSGSLGTMAVDGTVTELVGTESWDSPLGGAAAAGFVDADTVLYSRILPGSAWQLDVHTVEIDGSDDQLLGSLDLGAPPDVISIGVGLVDGTTLYTQATTIADGGNGIWRYDADRDAFGRILEDGGTGNAAESLGHSPVASTGGLLLSVKSLLLQSSTSFRDHARFFDLTTTDGATSVTIDDLDDDYMIMSAALSPDGANVAVYEFYRSDDSAMVDSASVGRVSIATTASVLAGAPAWSTITDVGPGVSGRNLDRFGTSLSWPTPDRLYVELLDAAFVIDVAAG